MSTNSSSASPNTLGLDDDGDDWEIVVELERAFGLKITDEEAKSIMLVGHLYDVLLARLGPGSGEKCATAMCYYRLRRAILQNAPNLIVTPKTKLADICQGSPKLAFRKLGHIAGLTLARPMYGRIGYLGMAMTLVSIFVGFFGGLFITYLDVLEPLPGPTLALICTALFCSGVGLMWADPMQLSRRLDTLGDLATVTAALNYGQLIKEGARHRPQELWEALAEVLSAFNDTLPPKDIHRETYLLQATFDEARKAGALKQG